MSGILVTGTDTGVGKTAVAAGLTALLRGEGFRVAAMKPAETGHTGPGWPADAACLREASGLDLPRATVVPFVFAEPLAPNVAARGEGRPVDPLALDAAYAELAAGHDLVVVEGAGGLSVRITDDLDHADLARRWGLPVLVVARAGLGTLNHTLLTVSYAHQRGLRVLGVVVNGMPSRPDAAAATNPDEMRRILAPLGVPVLGVLPWMEGVDTGAGRWRPMEGALRRHLDLAAMRAWVPTP